ncbi:MAG: PVC-type heme-binding CxxCH protein [Phycisphaerae bacterium]
MPRCASLLLLVAFPALAVETVKLEGRTYTVPDGMTIERVAGPPLVDRPITIAFDPQGRLYASDSSGSIAKAADQLKERPHRIVRLEDSDGDGVYDRQTVFADRMMFPEGTLFHGGSLYVAAPPSIWKLTDTDGDGVADRREEWFDGKTLTNCANDLHGPYLGHDGMLYWTKGAFAKQTYNVNGKEFTTRAAHVFRATPDGRNIEPVMTGGMDNPVDVAFLPSGERILSATFLQHPAGGKRDGLVHAVYGGVYGKVHDVLDGHVRTSPDVMPVLSHLGPAASCGLHCYESAALGKQYTGNLFSCAFNLRKVFRHLLTPSGATFTSKDEDFVTCDDADFHPTDVIEDADGSLLIVDTGGWYKLCCPTSRLHRPAALVAVYRVRRKDAPKVDDAWGLQIEWEKLTPAELAKLLDDERVMVRKRAVETIAAAGPDQGRRTEAVQAIDHALQSPNVRTRLAAVWTATRVHGPEARATVRAALADSADDVRVAACHSVALWRDALATPELHRLLGRGSSPTVRRAAAEAAGRCGRPESAEPLLDAAWWAAKADPVDRISDHSITFALYELVNVSAKAKDTVAAVAIGNPDRAFGPGRRAAIVATDQSNAWPADSRGSAAREMLEGAARDPRMTDTLVWLLIRHPEWIGLVGGELSKWVTGYASWLDGTPESRARLRDAVVRLTTIPTMQAVLADLAARGGATRRDALEFMASAELKAVPDAWVAALPGALADADVRVVSAAVRVARKVTAKQATPELSAVLTRAAARGDLSDSLKLECLAALPPTRGKGSADGAPELSVETTGMLVTRAGTAPSTGDRLRAAEVLARHKLPADALQAIAKVVETAGPLELPHLLAALGQTGDPAVGAALVASLEKSKAAQALRPDAINAALKAFPTDVKARAAPLLARLAPDAEKQKARLDELAAKLPAGDVGRGQNVFHSTKAACAACHTVGYVGGKVGPDLSKIGAIRQERDLLESVVFPSASFVQTYEPTSVELADGDVVSGIVRKSDDEAIVLATGPEQETRVARKDVKEVRPGQLSVMPAGLDQQLTPQELADLIAFLKACK